MKAFLWGRAAHYYMTFVAPTIKKWSVESLRWGLFDCCFPSAFRRQMRTRFYASEQGKWTVCEFLQYLQSMAAWLPDISGFQITQQYWDGANSYLRIEWTDTGLTPDYSSLMALEIAPEHFEQAEKLWEYEERRQQICEHTKPNRYLQWDRGGPSKQNDSTNKPGYTDKYQCPASPKEQQNNSKFSGWPGGQGQGTNRNYTLDSQQFWDATRANDKSRLKRKPHPIKGLNWQPRSKMSSGQMVNASFARQRDSSWWIAQNKIPWKILEYHLQQSHWELTYLDLRN